MRFDQLLVDKSLVTSRSKAKQLIQSGGAYIYDQSKNDFVVETSPSKNVTEETNIKINSDHNEIKYVSRAGIKLEGALDKTQINVKDLEVLDVGLSTGGFSHCLLNNNVKSILGIDVGHDQLHMSLRNEPRLKYLDGINARRLDDFTNFQELAKNKFDLIVMDVSFISISHIVPEIKKYLKSDGVILSLVKPQFELNREHLNKKGIVADIASYKIVREKIQSVFTESNLDIINYFRSPIEGKDGNMEFFIYAKLQ